MIFRNELTWQKLTRKAQVEETFVCPYCNTRVRSLADIRLHDAELGAIKYHIFKCTECYMPVIMGTDKKIIPASQILPFDDVRYLPASIEKLYIECRRCFSNECYHSVIMVSRSLLMHVAVDKGDVAGKSFVKYIDYFQNNGFIGSQNREWVDKIRQIGNKYVHELDEATKEDAEKVILFIKQLLGNLYEMPALAR